MRRIVSLGVVGFSFVFGISLPACSSASNTQGGAGGVSANGGAGGRSPSAGNNGVAGAAVGGSSGASSGGRTGTGGSVGATGGSGGAATGGSGGKAGSGGTGGTGGTGGSGGKPPVVGDCSNLGAPGAWVEITPTGVKNTQALAQDPFTYGTIWLGASPSGNTGSGAGGVYRSTDCGATWTHVNTGAKGSDVDKGAIWSLALDPVNKGTMYVIGAYGALGLFKSTNGGVDWTQTLPGGGALANAMGNNQQTPAFIGSVTMDPNDHLHLAVGTHSNCTGTYAPACGAESTDGGTTWRVYKTDFMSGWAEQTGPYIIDATTILYAELFGGMWLTTSNGTAWKNVAPTGVNGATGGEYTHKPIYTGKDGRLYLPSVGGAGLMQSTDQGKTWTRIQNAPNGSYQSGFTVEGGKLFIADWNSRTYWKSTEADPTKWTSISSSNIPSDQGPVYLEYDPPHDLLYSSNFEGRLWRMAKP